MTVASAVPSVRALLATTVVTVASMAAWGALAQSLPGSGDVYDAERLSREGFVPAPAPLPGDEVPGGLFLVLAYASFFVAILAYVFILLRRQRALASELHELRKRLEDVDDRLDEARGGPDKTAG